MRSIVITDALKVCKANLHGGGWNLDLRASEVDISSPSQLSLICLTATLSGFAIFALPWDVTQGFGRALRRSSDLEPSKLSSRLWLGS